MEFKEQFLYHIWDAQHLNSDLTTVSGKELEIMHQGRWNTDSGPDFKAAIIRIGPQVYRGDVEIHVRSYDWDLHNHSENKAFNSTILHVVYQHDQPYDYTIKEDGNKLEVLAVENQLNEDIIKLLKKYKAKDFQQKDKHCSFFGGIEVEVNHSLLLNYGLQRLEKKIRRFNTELYFSDYNQLLYQGILESLGYSKNKFQMLHLSLQLPYTRLKEYKYLGMEKRDLIALLLCGTGLIDHLPVTFTEEFKEQWKKLYREGGFCEMQFDIEWQLFRIRPINHPAVRLLQIVDFLYESLDNSFFYKIIKLFSFPRDGFNRTRFRSNYHQLLISRDNSLPEKMILGVNRKDVIMINVILPLAILYARNMSFEDFEMAAMQVYKQYYGLPENYITKGFKQYMTRRQNSQINRKAVYQQGLLEIYYDYCIHHDCENCKAVRDEILDSIKILNKTFQVTKTWKDMC